MRFQFPPYLLKQEGLQLAEASFRDKVVPMKMARTLSPKRPKPTVSPIEIDTLFTISSHCLLNKDKSNVVKIDEEIGTKKHYYLLLAIASSTSAHLCTSGHLAVQ